MVAPDTVCPSPSPPRTAANYCPSCVDYFAWARNWQLLALSPSPALNQYDMTEWLIWPSFSRSYIWNMKPCDTLWQPHLPIHKWTLTENHAGACPAAFKASLDRLGCSWKVHFHVSRGQTHLVGKKKKRGGSGMSGYLLKTSFTFFLSFFLASFDQ